MKACTIGNTWIQKPLEVCFIAVMAMVVKHCYFEDFNDRLEEACERDEENGCCNLYGVKKFRLKKAIGTDLCYKCNAANDGEEVKRIGQFQSSQV